MKNVFGISVYLKAYRLPFFSNLLPRKIINSFLACPQLEKPTKKVTGLRCRSK
jgi:hypothetical protein